MRFAADVNLLLYAHHPEYDQHEAARDWLAAQMQADGLALPWAVLLSFIRLSVKNGVLQTPRTVPAVWLRVEQMLDTRRIWLVEPGARHRELMARMLPLVEGRGDEISDTHLAAVCIEHRLTLCTADRGFNRFATVGLSLHNPLQ